MISQLNRGMLAAILREETLGRGRETSQEASAAIQTEARTRLVAAGMGGAQIEMYFELELKGLTSGLNVRYKRTKKAKDNPEVEHLEGQELPLIKVVKATGGAGWWRGSQGRVRSQFD